MSLAKIKMARLCYHPLRILWAAIRNSFFQVNGKCHLECSQKRQTLSFVMLCCCVSKQKCWDRRSLFCVITCASSSHLSAPLYSFCSLKTQTGIHLSLSASIFSSLCGLKPIWPRTTSAAIASTSERARAFCALHCYRSDTPVTQQHLLREHAQVFAPVRPLWILQRLCTHMQNRGR